MPEHELDAILAARIAGASDDELRQLVSSVLTERQKGAQPLRAAQVRSSGNGPQVMPRERLP